QDMSRSLKPGISLEAVSFNSPRSTHASRTEKLAQTFGPRKASTRRNSMSVLSLVFQDRTPAAVRLITGRPRSAGRQAGQAREPISCKRRADEAGSEKQSEERAGSGGERAQTAPPPPNVRQASLKVPLSLPGRLPCHPGVGVRCPDHCKRPRRS